MARISLLFSLALVLAIGFVSAHPPNQKKTQKILCPPTLSGLQTFPYTEISKLIEKKVESAPDTMQFKALFSICKAYNDYLGASKVAFAKDVFGSVHTKNALMTKAMIAAQASVGVEGKLAVKLRKSYATMAEGYVTVVKKIAEISAKYKFDVDSKISKSDRIEMDRCLIKLKGSISIFMKVITRCSKKFSIEKKIGAGSSTGNLISNDIGFEGQLIDLGSHVTAKTGAYGGASARVDIEGLFGGKAHFGVGGSAKVGGRNGFGH